MSDKKPPDGEPLRPTVMKAPPPRERTEKKEKPAPAAAPAMAPDAPPATVSGPTTVSGTRRERIEATLGAIQALSPASSVNTCKAAAQMIEAFPVGKANDRRAVLWGHELQKSYSERITKTLALAQEPLIEQARTHVARMMEILGAIDLMAVYGHGKSGIFGALTRSMNNSIDTAEELESALSELRLLVDRLGTAIERLLGLADRVREHADVIRQLESDMQAAAVAAVFLSDYFAHEQLELAQRFTDRAMSLTASIVQLQQGETVRRIQIEQPLQLINTIQNVALVALPAFIANLTGLLTATKKASFTEASDASHQLRDILMQLKN